MEVYGECLSEEDSAYMFDTDSEIEEVEYSEEDYEDEIDNESYDAENEENESSRLQIFSRGILEICDRLEIYDLDETKLEKDVAYGSSILKQALVKAESLDSSVDTAEGEPLVNQTKNLHISLKGLIHYLVHAVTKTEKEIQKMEHARIRLRQQEVALRNLDEILKSKGFSSFYSDSAPNFCLETRELRGN